MSRRRKSENPPSEEEQIAKWRETFNRWLSDKQTFIGVFENQALDSASAGSRIALAFALADYDKMALGSRAPDTAAGMGWKFGCVGKALTVEQAINLMLRRSE